MSHPRHYSGDGVECMQAMRATIGHKGMIDYWWGCAFKYLWRWKSKNGIEDLEKCKQCIQYLIDEVEDEL